DAGDVLVDGVSVVNASPSELKRVRRRVGYVFQNAALFDSLTVAENLWLAQDDGTGRRSLRECREEAAELLRRVNLDPSVLDMYPAQLSGGLRRRVGVARAIASQARDLLYDEPTTGLDPVNAETIDSLLLELDRELGVTSIVVTHDLESAFTVAERIALLYDGKIRVVATPEELLASTDPVVQRFIRRGRINSPVSVGGEEGDTSSQRRRPGAHGAGGGRRIRRGALLLAG